MSSVNDVWAFGGADIASANTRVQKVDGWQSIPASRGSNFVVPGRVGERFGRKVHGPRRLALGLHLLSEDPTVILSEASRLGTVFARPGEQNLVQTRPDGKVLTAQARVGDFSPADVSEVGVLFAGVADFDLSDPYFYGPQEVGVAAQFTQPPLVRTLIDQWVAGVRSAGPWTVANDGEVRTAKVVVTIWGNAGSSTEPTIVLTNETNGCKLTYHGFTQNYPASLVIDCDACTAVVNDGIGGLSNAIGAVSHSGDLNWFVLEPGNNILSLAFGLTPVGGGGALDVKFTPAYL